jgi:hypothetical protein
MSNLSNKAASAVMTFLASASLGHSAVLASYADGSAADDSALLNVAAVSTSYATSALGDNNASDGGTRTEFGVTAGNTPAGPTAGSSAGSEWLFSRASKIPSTPSSTANYYSFTVTASPGFTLDLTNLLFDMVSAVSSDPGGLNSSAQVFYATNGSSTFTPIGSAVTSSVLSTAPLHSYSAVTTANINLSTLTGLNSVSIRIGMADNSGSPSKGTFVQGIQLNGTAVPEPSSLGLLAGGIVLLAARRRRI